MGGTSEYHNLIDKAKKLADPAQASKIQLAACTPCERDNKRHANTPAYHQEQLRRLIGKVQIARPMRQSSQQRGFVT